MAYLRLVYDDHDTPGQMASDCVACDPAALPSEGPSDRTASRMRLAPSIRYDDYPRETLKPEISISQATAHLAQRLYPSQA